MFFFSNPRKKLRKFLETDDLIDLSDIDYEMYISFDTLMDYIEEIPNPNQQLIVAEVLSIIFEQSFVKKMENEESRKDLLNLHQKLISKGIFDIWNNELFYSQQDFTVCRECAAYLTDLILKKHYILTRLSVLDLQLYLSKQIDPNKMKVYDIKEDFFVQRLRVSDLYDTVDFLDELSFFNYDEKVECDKSYKFYNFNISFEDNLKKAISNYDNIKNKLIKSTVDIYTDSSRMKKENLDIGKYIDFRSLYSEALFLNIPDYSNKYLISLSKSEYSRSAKELHLNVFDVENHKNADDNIYKMIIDKIKYQKT